MNRGERKRLLTQHIQVGLWSKWQRPRVVDVPRILSLTCKSIASQTQLLNLTAPELRETILRMAQRRERPPAGSRLDTESVRAVEQLNRELARSVR
ncbi:MAG: hypothetical protein R3B90_10220 [Planctomycetaceae bacterium]